MWAVVSVDPARLDDKIERVNITLPRRVLARLDAAARPQVKPVRVTSPESRCLNGCVGGFFYALTSLSMPDEGKLVEASAVMGQVDGMLRNVMMTETHKRP